MSWPHVLNGAVVSYTSNVRQSVNFSIASRPECIVGCEHGGADVRIYGAAGFVRVSCLSHQPGVDNPVSK